MSDTMDGLHELSALDASKEAVQLVWDIRARARERFIGRRVVFDMGEYKGRLGEVVEVVVDDNNGLLFLVYPYRHDGKGFLTTRVDARTYWPASTLRWSTEMEDLL